MDTPTFPQLFKIARDEVLSRSPSLTREVVDRPGTDANAIVAAGAVVGDELVGQLARVTADSFLTSAAKEKLDRLVFDRYRLTRNGATPALGEVQFRTTTPVALGFTIPVGTKVTTASGTEFLTTAAASFPTASTGPVTVAVVSTLAGLDQHARPGTITSIPAAVVGAPSDLTVSNALATVGAGNAELDSELRSRAQLFYSTAYRGTHPALVRGALTVPGVRTAAAYDATNEFGDPARWVQVVVTDQFAEQFVQASETTPVYDAQAQSLATSVNAALEEFRAAGIYVVTSVGVVSLVAITLALRVRLGFEEASVLSQAKAFAQDYVNGLTSGENLVIADLDNAIARVPGVEPLGGSVVSPTSDLVAGATTAFRTSESLITVASYLQVSA